MGLFYEVPVKDIFRIRKEIFEMKGIPALQKNGFEKSPFSGTRYGRYDSNLYAYDLCRLKPEGALECITTYISRKDRWIKISLNIFQLEPHLESLIQLIDLDGIKFHLPPNSINEMRLRSDGVKGIPLFNCKQHKLKSFYTENGFKNCTDQLSKLIEGDLTDIDSFVKTWHTLHTPMVTDWEGKPVSNG